MTPVRQIFWKLLVVGMIPFILGAGLPQMQCRCAAAKGQRWCECCFRKAEPPSSKPPSKTCCQRRLALQHEPSSAVRGSASGCPTCHQFTNPKTGSCCSLKQTEAPTLSKLVDAPNLEITWMWLSPASADSGIAITTSTARQELLLRASLIPPLDRVIVFEHLLI
jgi:hypothetical protein